jgi:hypothetical protein
VTLTSFPNGIIGFPIIGAVGNFPIINPGGNVWFVSSLLGNDGNDGSYGTPFATLSAAASNSSLMAGDNIVLLEGHTETVTAAAGIALSMAGVSVIGSGSGTYAPTITFTTSTAATFLISGAGVSVQGLRFVNGIASQVTMLDVQAKSVLILGNTFVEGAATTGLSFINTVNASTANMSDGLQIIGNTFHAPTAGNYNHAIGLTTVHDNVEIGGNVIYGNFALSGIHNITGMVLTNLKIHDNTVTNLTAAKPALNLISACTGWAANNKLMGGDATVNSMLFNTALKVLPGNSGQHGSMDATSEYWLVKKGVVSNTITTGGVAISTASVGGELAVVSTIMKTNSVGLSGITGNVQLQSNNTNGAAVFWSTPIATLGASATVCIGVGASATPLTVIELGKVISISSSATNGTNAGTVDVYVRFRRITNGANITSA